jgi:hypothetical protein
LHGKLPTEAYGQMERFWMGQSGKQQKA